MKVANQENLMKKFEQNSCLFGGSSAYLEDLYETYLMDPNKVSEEWRHYFSQLPKAKNQSKGDFSHAAVRDEFLQRAKSPIKAASLDTHYIHKQGQVTHLVNAYRSHGHHQAKLDPLGVERLPAEDLDYRHYGLTENDLALAFEPAGFRGCDSGQIKLKDLIQALEETYCGSIGIEYKHITNTTETEWLEQRLETSRSKPNFSQQQKIKILKHLVESEGMENYLGKKYVGQKRFSLEGGESLIPMLVDLTQESGRKGIKELVIGMAHRGRLNVLVNVFGKEPSDLFNEFEGKLVEQSRSGDAKYHMGFSSDVETPGGVLHLTLGFNPSHLEIISPVVSGSVRARQDRRLDTERNQVLSLVIHGDAAFAGQGVVMETFNMSQARGYCVGGTVHIIVNNQIGFTTSNPLDARSTLYCSDVAKMVQSPILHVNGDDPEAVVFAAQIALDYRMKFNKDIVIDLVCYRRQGHNEADEPSVTQPAMYQKIRQHQTTMMLYTQQLLKEGIIAKDDEQKMLDEYRRYLDTGKSVVPLVAENPDIFHMANWGIYLHQGWQAHADTQVPMEQIKKVGEKLALFPEGFVPHKIVEKEMDTRRQMLAGKIPLNWGCAEILAYATLLDDGYGVRLSGQDCGRGTFSHRHAVLHNNKTNESYVPLRHLSEEQGEFTIIDSVLSEEAVLAFEYGYASAEPRHLILWEAQFGDFANGAQVVIDQFISSGFQKWGRLCGLVLLLPHGYEGMGPEHSSARLERFLQLCAEQNIQVCVPTTPAQCFHMLRRQLIRPFRKPLVVMTPKSLLRHKLATSTLEELTQGQFKLIIPEVDAIKAKEVKRVILCSGKVYYDLLAQRRENKQTDVAILRVEQLYPFPLEELTTELAKYDKAKEIVWCQEEPKNQGAWYASKHNVESCLLKEHTLYYAGRAASAAPAVGDLKRHIDQQKKLVNAALIEKCEQ